MEDPEIVELYLSRDETAIVETQKKYGKHLQRLSQRIVEDWQTAEECENDTYWKAWDSIPPHEPKSYFYAFLARITRHLSLNCCRERNALKRSAIVCELSAEMEQCIPAPDDMACRMEEADFTQMLNRFLEMLSPQKRKVFLRRYWYMDSINRIAQRYGLAPNTVKSMLFRTRQELREYIEREGDVL